SWGSRCCWASSASAGPAAPSSWKRRLTGPSPNRQPRLLRERRRPTQVGGAGGGPWGAGVVGPLRTLALRRSALGRTGDGARAPGAAPGARPARWAAAFRKRPHGGQEPGLRLFGGGAGRATANQDEGPDEGEH